MERFVQTRSAKYYEKLYLRYFVVLCRYVQWLSGASELAKDVAQTIFVQIFAKPTLFDPSQNFKVWLFTLARNRMRNEWRNAAVRAQHAPRIAQHLDVLATQTRTFPVAQTLAVEQAMQQLSEPHQEVLALKYSSNFTIPEISDILGCSQGTVKSRLFYAIQQLRKHLNQ